LGHRPAGPGAGSPHLVIRLARGLRLFAALLPGVRPGQPWRRAGGMDWRVPARGCWL